MITRVYRCKIIKHWYSMNQTQISWTLSSAWLKKMVQNTYTTVSFTTDRTHRWKGENLDQVVLSVRQWNFWSRNYRWKMLVVNKVEVHLTDISVCRELCLNSRLINTFYINIINGEHRPWKRYWLAKNINFGKPQLNYTYCELRTACFYPLLFLPPFNPVLDNFYYLL